jgi:hypothetical protein
VSCFVLPCTWIQHILALFPTITLPLSLFHPYLPLLPHSPSITVMFSVHIYICIDIYICICVLVYTYMHVCTVYMCGI